MILKKRLPSFDTQGTLKWNRSNTPKFAPSMIWDIGVATTHTGTNTAKFIPLRCLVAHDCGYPLSRYTCRATRVAADFLGIYSVLQV